MKPTYHFEGEVALVTGAGSGMGLTTAAAFAAQGASVVLADINEQALAQAVETIRSAGGTATYAVCDVSDENQAAMMVKHAVQTYGRLDMAFNNAGVQAPPADPADQTAEDFDRVVAINLRGVWASMKHELKQMRQQGSGAIVNCASVGGLIAQVDLAAYNATKFGVVGLTKSSALKYAPLGIRVNAVCPGTIDTPMVAHMLEHQKEAMAELMKKQVIGRLGHPDEVAAAVLWLCSSGASFVIGATLAVDGGFSAN